MEIKYTLEQFIDRLYFTRSFVLQCQKTIFSSQGECAMDLWISHFSYYSSLHLATDTVTTEELANPGFGMKIGIRDPVPLSYPNV